MLRRALNLWRNLVRRSRVEEGLDEEVRATQELLVAEKLRSGLTPAEAERAARLELGSRDSLKEEVRDVRAGASLEALLQDVRHSLRLMRRAPALRRRRRYAGPRHRRERRDSARRSPSDRRAAYSEADRWRSPTPTRSTRRWGARCSRRASRWRSGGQRSFESIAAFDSARDASWAATTPHASCASRGSSRTSSRHSESPRHSVAVPRDDRAAGHVPASGAERGPAARAVMLDHGAWQRSSRGPRDRRLRGAAEQPPRQVIGVLPRGFVGPSGPADFFLAFELAPARDVGAGWLRLVGRLQAGMTHEAAARDIAAAWASRERPQDFGSLAMSSMPLREAMVGRARTPLLLLLGRAALVLLVTCANLAGVLLSRALSRRKEPALRMALGAGQPVWCGSCSSRARCRRGRRCYRAAAGQLLPDCSAPGGAGPARLRELSSILAAVLAIAVVAIGCGLGFGLRRRWPSAARGAGDPARRCARCERGAPPEAHARGARGGSARALCQPPGWFEPSPQPVRDGDRAAGIDASGVLSAQLQLPTLTYPTLRHDAVPRAAARTLRALPGWRCCRQQDLTVNPRIDPSHRRAPRKHAGVL
jgi:hypothetical protein